jgi:hypothetical protein
MTGGLIRVVVVLPQLKQPRRRRKMVTVTVKTERDSCNSCGSDIKISKGAEVVLLELGSPWREIEISIEDFNTIHAVINR